MPVTRRDFIRGGVAAFTVSFTAPAFLSDIARAQGARSRSLVVRVSRRRQRCAEHRGAVSGSVLLQPPTDDRGSGGTGAADRQRHERSSAWLAPQAHRAAQHLQRRPARDHPADRLSEFEPVALPGIRHLGHGQSIDARRPTGWLGRYLETVPKDALVGMVDDARSAAGAALAGGERAGDPGRARVRLRQLRTMRPRRSTSGRRRSGSRRMCRSIGPISRSSTAPRRGAFDTLDRVASVAAYTGTVAYPEQRFRDRAAHGRRFNRSRDRHARVLGADRRLRHARHPGQRRAAAPTAT